MAVETPAFHFTRKYNELMSDELVHSFMSKCAYDDVKKDFDMRTTISQVANLWTATCIQNKSVAFTTRTKILLYITELFYYCITVEHNKVYGDKHIPLAAIPVEW